MIHVTPKGPVEIGPYRPGDEEGIQELFRLVFGSERPIEEWNWLFRDCPEGIHCYLGRTEDGRIVSQFCGIPVRMKIRDEVFTFGQIVDSMVHPDYRTGLKKKGLFSDTVDEFVDRFGHREEEIIMMGLPNPPAFGIGRKLCGYVPMGKVYFHTKEIEPEPGAPELSQEVSVKGNRYVVSLVETMPADVDELWERLAPRYTVVSPRDHRHLSWRYTSYLEKHRYHVLELRAPDGVLHGFCVGVAGYLGHPDGIIADWFVDGERPGAAQALLRVVEDLMRKVGMHRVQCLLNPMCEESRFFEDRGYTLAPTHYRMVSRTYAPDVVTPEWLNRYWYYTLGDFDVV